MIDTSRFYVISVISNPRGYRSRYELYHRFEKHMKCSGAKLITVELAFGRNEFEIKDQDHVKVVRVRSYDEYWHKENLINLGMQHLPHDWKYVAWIDADIMFTYPDWVEMTVKELQRYMVLQMWENCIDLGPKQEVIQVHKSFISQYVKNGCNPPQGAGWSYGYYGHAAPTFWHPGYAWAARREAIESLGGLIDEGALGSGDHHMAHALIHQSHRSYPHTVTHGYKKVITDWEGLCRTHVKKDVGYLPVTITHWWHGQKKKRFYKDRWDIITQNQFDPLNDLKYDSQGLYQLEVKSGDERMIRFRDQARAYLGAREEDSIDLDVEPLA